MKPKEVKKTVKQAYGKIASESEACSCCGCGDQNAAQEISKSIGYSDEELSVVPEANLGLGCGNPVVVIQTGAVRIGPVAATERIERVINKHRVGDQHHPEKDDEAQEHMTPTKAFRKPAFSAHAQPLAH